jgi:single-strand DNA-binding protein
VVVHGRLKVRSEGREGQSAWTSADIDAVAIGHDLARGTSAFRRTQRPENTVAGSSEQPEPVWETPPGESADRQEAVAVT